MDTIFMNSANSKKSNFHSLLINLSDKINLHKKQNLKIQQKKKQEKEDIFKTYMHFLIVEKGFLMLFKAEYFQLKRMKVKVFQALIILFSKY